MLFSNSRQIQYCIWNSSVVPKQFFTTLIQLPQRVLCPFIRPTSWLVTYVTESTNYSASTRDVASDQQLMFSSPVRGEFESYLLHVFVNRIHNDLALQTKSLSTSVACIPYPSDAALYSHGLTCYDFQRYLSRCSQPFPSSLSLSATPLCLPPTTSPLIPSKLYMQSPVESPGACISLTPDTVSLSHWQITLNLLSTFSAHGLVTPVAPAYSTL